MIRVDAVSGALSVLVDPVEWAARVPATEDLSASHVGIGRELFSAFRANVGTADTGASIFAV